MIIINMSHKVSKEQLEPYSQKHKEFIKNQITKGTILAAGPKLNALGGVIMMDVTEQKAHAVMQCDPYINHKLSEYSIIEFDIKLSTNNQLLNL